jgi:hypothetical protein
VPAFGAIFSSRLAAGLADRMPPGAAAHVPSRLGPAQIAGLPAALRGLYVAAYAAALRPVFLVAAGIAAVGFAVTWLLEERPLRQTVADQQIRDSFAAPRDATSLEELETRLSTLARKQNRHLVYDHLTATAGLELDAGEAWLLLRLHEQEEPDDGALAERLRVPLQELAPLLGVLRTRGLVEPDEPRLTAAGREAGRQMTDARSAEISSILDEWQPAQHAEVRQLIDRFARSLSAAPPFPQRAAT